MIAADTSTWIAFLQGETAPDTIQLDGALRAGQVRMVPIVLAELLSAPILSPEASRQINAVRILELSEGFWHRSGRLRASIHQRGRRAMMADVLIAQCCIDHGLPLLTRDADYRIIAECGRLRLVQPTSAD